MTSSTWADTRCSRSVWRRGSNRSGDDRWRCPTCSWDRRSRSLRLGLREPVKSSAASSLIPLGTSGPGHPLFLVHPIGGGVLCYNDLARCLDGARAVFGLQASGLDGDAVPEADLVRMASRYVDAILAEHPEGPYLLGGWSMGGVVALEMAMQLSAAGREVPLVFLIDCSAPVPRHTSACH